MNIAIVGCGKHALNFHVPSFIRLNKEVTIIGVYDKDLNKAKHLSKKFNIKKVYIDQNEVFKDHEVDIIDICSPAFFHYKQIIKSLNSNKHVMVEKPFVLKEAQAKKIFNLSKQKKLKIMCLQHQRFRNETKKMINFINSKKKLFGKIYYIEGIANYFNSIPIQTNNSFTKKSLSGGGPIIDHGSHIIDLVFYILNFPKITEIKSYLFKNFIKKKKNHIYDVEEKGIVNIILDKNILFNFETSYLSNKYENDFSIKIFFENGFFSWPDLKYNFRKNMKFNSRKLKVDKYFASDTQFKHFFDCVRLNKKIDVNLQQTIKVVSVIDQIYKKAFIVKKC